MGVLSRFDYWNCIIWADSRSPETDEYYTRVVYASPANANELWKLNVTNATQFSWIKLAPATPPQEFDLPLAEGVSALGGWKNTYSKDQFGIVRVWFSVHFESIPAKATPVFTLPAGFRPDSVCSFAAILAMNEFYCASVTVGVDGTATVDRGTIGQTGPINLHGYIEFPAA